MTMMLRQCMRKGCVFKLDQMLRNTTIKSKVACLVRTMLIRDDLFCAQRLAPGNPRPRGKFRNPGISRLKMTTSTFGHFKANTKMAFLAYCGVCSRGMEEDLKNFILQALLPLENHFSSIQGQNHQSGSARFLPIAQNLALHC